jgi:hypothetical protein
VIGLKQGRKAEPNSNTHGRRDVLKQSRQRLPRLALSFATWFKIFDPTVLIGLASQKFKAEDFVVAPLVVA